ncbi:MAG: hypothetical protein H0U95_13600 [Bacteroidetes bacterium]|nr:hypothetical protein [Bacteroidota bacterium]
MENLTTQQVPQGKKMALAGFIISLIALIGYFIVALTVAAQAVLGGGYGLGIFWLLLSLGGMALCAMGMMKLGKTGGKKGLAVTGIVLGLIATALTIMLVSSISDIQKAGTELGSELKGGLEEGLNNLIDTAAINDQLNDTLNNMADSSKAY